MSFAYLTGLAPDGHYKIYVSAENGVSSMAGSIEDHFVLVLDQQASSNSTQGLLIGIICLAVLSLVLICLTFGIIL